MKIYILTDLEGPAMVSRFRQTREEGPDKQTAMKLLTWEINAAVDGILDTAPDAEVVVWDGHGSGGIDVLEFHPKAKLIARGPIRPPYYLDETYDALFFVGQHDRSCEQRFEYRERLELSKHGRCSLENLGHFVFLNISASLAGYSSTLFAFLTSSETIANSIRSSVRPTT